MGSSEELRQNFQKNALYKLFIGLISVSIKIILIVLKSCDFLKLLKPSRDYGFSFSLGGVLST